MDLHEYKKMDVLEQHHWWFKAKRKFLEITLKTFLQGAKGTVLDIGCGTGAVMEFLLRQGYHVEGVDFNETALAYCARKGLVVQQGTIDHLPFYDNTFNIVFALDVLEHVARRDLALREVKRVLKPGGLFIVTVPAHQFLFSYHDRALHHVKRYSWYDFKQELSASFTIQHMSWIHSAILLPTILKRLVIERLSHKVDQLESDVKPSSQFIGVVMDAWYFLETGIFQICLKLPWGLSIISVAKKNDIGIL